jgi:hypothetical protein
MSKINLKNRFRKKIIIKKINQKVTLKKNKLTTARGFRWA